MENSKPIKHPGRILSIEGRKVQVLIFSQSACSSCDAKGACNMSEMEEKIIDIYLTDDKAYTPNEMVNVVMSQKHGNKAVFFGYFLPMVLVVLALVVALAITGNEPLSGLLSLIVLVPYYLGLYLLKDTLKKEFQFQIESLIE